MSDYLAITPGQIARAVGEDLRGRRRCLSDSRTKTTMPSPDVNLIREIVTSIRSRSDIVVSIVTGSGSGMNVEEVYSFLREVGI